VEPRLRTLLPADLYATAWLDPSPAMLTRVFEHLRTLQRILRDYVPRRVAEAPPSLGRVRHAWQAGTLLFTDLAGFTPLMESNLARGRAGAETLLGVLNTYFAEMIEIVVKSGGDLLEFTGDALLAQFPADARQTDTARAVRAGLRMQRAMARFACIETPQGTCCLGMRVGIHPGRFIAADLGTPRRMEHVLLGGAVQQAKDAESAGRVGRVCLTRAAWERVQTQFRSEPGEPGHVLVVDDLSDEQLGEYDLAPSKRRPPSALLLDRSLSSLMAEIEQELANIEPLAGYLPASLLNLVVECAARRRIPPDFPSPTVVFANLAGLAETADQAAPEEEDALIAGLSRAVALMNAAVEARGGILKKVTYYLAGTNMLICFGVPNAHTDDAVRAAHAALALREVMRAFAPPSLGGRPASLTLRIGMARGPLFAAEIGDPRGRREFNLLGDTANTAARLMGRAAGNQILMTEAVQREIAHCCECEALGAVSLKGKAAPVPIYSLLDRTGF
jgi:class 3 adenylate cyclase